MRLSIISVGRLKNGPERELVERYRQRLEASGRSLGFTAINQIELSESKARREEDRRAEEAAAISAKLGNGVLVAFDERGKSLSSKAFSDQITNWRDSGREQASFIIGGADGLDETLRQKADLILSFGALTLPHQLVRVLVTEQLYRAITIIGGHPYHRDG
ncbi:23S rRNA (pseudouridine(1915)-N(3))-methyltransferase RlmH [Microvirga sp. W0021]|uniref:Ribosomal RNA large subunit methyltransferase H n=1 Tax=Hohaiivirga grylli TaxID=3133970 RepID=A0ABV0BEM9_9HYPH